MIAKLSPQVLLVALLVLAGMTAPAPASAAVSCPNPIPVVDENNCQGPGTMDWRLTPGSYSDEIGGFSVRTSYDRGQDVALKIARNSPTEAATNVDIEVFRTGWYGGLGARRIPAASVADVPLNNDFTCNPRDAQTGRLDCGNWNVTHTIPGSALPASGVYVAKLTTDTWRETWIVFTVRDDARSPASKLLFVLPVANYQAYNLWGGKSLYFDKDGGPQTVSGGGRAVEVSFNRPLWAANDGMNRYYEPDFRTVQWLEQQGYDVSYSDDVQAHLDGAQLRRHKGLVIPAHSEYWSLEQFQNFVRARDAGVNIASFGANTSYWKVRYEDGQRTLVCYKTVQGDGSGSSGATTPNDPGPDGATGTADDALGLDGIAGTADDHPENSTTTFRDNGAPNGDPNAPPGGRVGPDMPENQLFGVMYVGDNDAVNFQFVVPAANGGGEFAGDRIWRNAGLDPGTSTTVAGDYVGWEWDAVPTQQQYLSRQPQGVTRLSESTIAAPPTQPSSWIVDEGRNRDIVPPPGQPATVNAVKYRAPSGALVFAAGTIQWYRGLVPSNDSSPSPRIQQATYNVFADMGVQPFTPAGVTLDAPNRPPTAVATATPTGGGVPLTRVVRRQRLHGPGRADRPLRMGPGRRRRIRRRSRSDSDVCLPHRRDPHRPAARDRPCRRERGGDPRHPGGRSGQHRAQGPTGPTGNKGPTGPSVGLPRSLVRISSVRLVRGAKLAIRIRCMAIARGACAGKAAATVSGARAGHRRFRGLSPNRTATLRVKLTRAALRRFQAGPARVRITLTVRDAAGLGVTTRRALMLPRNG